MRKEKAMRRLISLLVVGTTFWGAPSFGAQGIFSVAMTGPQEVPGPGDADGIASGTITLNDVTGAVSWNFTYANIATPLSAMHIHTGAAGASGGVLISLGVATSGGAGTLISSTVHGNLAQVTSVLNNPSGFYVNIHNAPFANGAIRGQLEGPVPAVSDWGLVVLSLLTLSAATVIIMRRRARAAI